MYYHILPLETYLCCLTMIVAILQSQPWRIQLPTEFSALLIWLLDLISQSKSGHCHPINQHVIVAVVQYISTAKIIYHALPLKTHFLFILTWLQIPVMPNLERSNCLWCSPVFGWVLDYQLFQHNHSSNYSTAFSWLTSQAGSQPNFMTLRWLNSGYILEVSDYFDYIKNRDVFFTIIMLMLVCYNRDSYSSFKDP